MKGRTILLDHLNGFETAALLIDGKLDDLLIDASDTARPGAIFHAIVERPLKGQGGVMVRLPGGTGFLKRAKGLSPGEPILVQVTGHAEPGKATPVTDKIIFKSRFAIVTPGAPGVNVSRAIRDEQERLRLKVIAGEAPHGLILRSSCEGADETEISEDIEAMLALAEAVLDDAEGRDPEALTEGDGPHGIAWRDWVAPAEVVTAPGCLAERGVLDQIADALRPEIPLKGAVAYIEPTRALVAVDVNTGGDTSPAAGLKANLALVAALPRALRVRGLGGQIVVDAAPMGKGARRQVEGALRAALKACPVDSSFIGWTALGHLEITRKRERLPLMELTDVLSDLR